MSMTDETSTEGTKIAGLTPAQQALVPIYKDKWMRIIGARKTMDRDRAQSGIQSAYAEVGLATPQIHFFDSPAAANTWLEMRTQQNPLDLGSFVLQFDILPGFCSVLLNRILNNGAMAQDAATPLDSLQSFQLIEALSETLSVPGMKPVARQIADPLFKQIDRLAKAHHQPSPFAPVLNNLISKVMQVFPQFIIAEQQQALRRSLQAQPWGNFLIETGEAIWQQLRPLTQPLEAEFEKASTYLWDELWKQIQSQPQVQELQTVLSTVWGDLQGIATTEFSGYESVVDLLPALDFYTTVLNQDCGIQHWSAIEKLTQESIWVYPFENHCIVIDHPAKYFFDPEHRLHREGSPALSFRDGHGVYAYQGVVLPERYGRCYPSQWQAEWIVTERNAELRRVLIAGIGYERMLRELRAEILDQWREYTLLRIADLPMDLEVNHQPVIEEPIHLLKMVCPSTAHLHVLRVPPDLSTAREAIRWANWGTDPEEFAIAT
jgi:hypothetical protein